MDNRLRVGIQAAVKAILVLVSVNCNGIMYALILNGRKTFHFLFYASLSKIAYSFFFKFLTPVYRV